MAAGARAQTLTHRGFFETRTFLFPQTAPGDSGQFVAEARLRWEPTWKPRTDLRFAAAVDARTDTHRMTERALRLDWQDRRLQRPAFSLRRASAQWHRGPVTIEAGRQFIRWGKADILNPTDRFAPRDYLNVADSDFMGVTAVRITIESGSETVDAVVAPRFTTSRLPLFNQRWAVRPPGTESIALDDHSTRFPGRAQFGLRWNHVGRRYECSAVFYDGFHHLPLFTGRLAGGPEQAAPVYQIERVPPQLRLYGGDVAVPTRWFTVKGEAAWFSSRTPAADEYVLWVAQLERVWGEWTFIGGYSGEQVTLRRNPMGFAPDRGLARSILARATYTIDSRRTLSAEIAARNSGDGVWARAEYSHELSPRLRATAGFTLIRGAATDFLGQFHRNSHGLLALRYSF